LFAFVVENIYYGDISNVVLQPRQLKTTTKTQPGYQFIQNPNIDVNWQTHAVSFQNLLLAEEFGVSPLTFDSGTGRFRRENINQNLNTLPPLCYKNL